MKFTKKYKHVYGDTNIEYTGQVNVNQHNTMQQRDSNDNNSILMAGRWRYWDGTDTGTFKLWMKEKYTASNMTETPVVPPQAHEDGQRTRTRMCSRCIQRTAVGSEGCDSVEEQERQCYVHSCCFHLAAQIEEQ